MGSIDYSKTICMQYFIIGDPIYLDDYKKDQLETARQQLEEALNSQADAMDQLMREDQS